MSLSAVDSAGVRWFQSVNNAGSLVSSKAPSDAIAQAAVDTPIQFSTDKTKAYRWRVDTVGTFSRQEVPVAFGQFEYLPMVSPNGTGYVVELDTSGNTTVTAFPSRLTQEYPFLALNRGEAFICVDTRFPLGGRRR